MSNKKIKNYIKAGLKYRFKIDDLKKDLLNQGFSSDSVNSAAKSVIKERNLKRRNNALVLSAVLLVFVFVMGYSFFGLTTDNFVGAGIKEPQIKETFIDSDGDGVIDGDELKLGTDPLVSDFSLRLP